MNSRDADAAEIRPVLECRPSPCASPQSFNALRLGQFVGLVLLPTRHRIWILREAPRSNADEVARSIEFFVVDIEQGRTILQLHQQAKHGSSQRLEVIERDPRKPRGDSNFLLIFK